MVRVYDCFTFFNELDVLEIRLNELANVVHRFVLVEATHTHQGQPKPLYYAENSQRFRRFERKITHVVVEFPEEPDLLARYPGTSVTWAREHFQRDMIVKGLTDCEPTDVVIISDVDEIPRATKVLEYLSFPGIKIFKQKLYYYWLNCQCIGTTDGREYAWLGSIMVQFSHLMSPQQMRNLCISTAREFVSPRWFVRLGARLYRKIRSLVGQTVTVVDNGGWHFSYLGGVENIMAKLQAFAHTELVTPEILRPEQIISVMQQGRDLFGRNLVFKFVPIDGSFPEYVFRNLDRFGNLIYANQDPTILSTSVDGNGKD